MNEFLILAFLFFCGSLIGWVIEFFFRKFFSSSNPEHKWVNPGFLSGPYLPLYGFSLCILYILAGLEQYIAIDNTSLRKSLLFIIMALSITFVEYIAGLIFIKGMHVKLWDYSDMKFNIQGIICPLFTFFWWVLSAIYYFLIHHSVLSGLEWLGQNLSFSFFIGMFYGILILDVIYTLQLNVKIKKFAKENDIVVKYDQLRADIREDNLRRKEKASFMFSFRSKTPLYDSLKVYLSNELEHSKNNKKWVKNQKNKENKKE